MVPSGYVRLGRSWRSTKGFRLSSGRLCFLRLVRVFRNFDILWRWLKWPKKGWRSRRRRSRSRSGDGTATRPEFKSCTYGRSNSFYAEAIADCLEFIRKTSVSVHGMPSLAKR
ncbi:hypothetical protein HPP92_019156 [Vanilla planifolia]|uniref:Uncharacterized protein n=1 Tax=Vanilla planifolia TaxID=51239 RepID=A0A835UKH0_VANPL|nr:hypothetical protein HPP92_019156 [Vanilla planifolia]